MSKIIKNVNKEAIVTENEVAPRTGAFEVTINSQLIYSKFDSGNFPNESEIYSWFE